MANASELNNYIVSFGGCDYSAAVYRAENLKIIDCSNMQGTHLYCDEDAGKEILEKISAEGVTGVHFIDTGDYHYVSKFMTDLIRKPFILIQIDHHTDMQETAFGGLLSCGSWAGAVLRENSDAKSCLLIGPPEKSIGAVSADVLKKVTWISEEMLAEETAADKIDTCLQNFFIENKGIPVYISVDKDVLKKSEAVTDWDQGILTLRQLCGILDRIFSYTDNVIGADICGGTTETEDTDSYTDIRKINENCDRVLYSFFVQYFLLRSSGCRE